MHKFIPGIIFNMQGIEPQYGAVTMPREDTRRMRKTEERRAALEVVLDDDFKEAAVDIGEIDLEELARLISDSRIPDHSPYGGWFIVTDDWFIINDTDTTTRDELAMGDLLDVREEMSQIRETIEKEQ